MYLGIMFIISADVKGNKGWNPCAWRIANKAQAGTPFLKCTCLAGFKIFSRVDGEKNIPAFDPIDWFVATKQSTLFVFPQDLNLLSLVVPVYRPNSTDYTKWSRSVGSVCVW